MKNRPKWSKKDFMIRSKLDELDEELKLKVNEALYERVAVSKGRLHFNQVLIIFG